MRTRKQRRSERTCRKLDRYLEYTATRGTREWEGERERRMIEDEGYNNDMY